LPNDNLFVNIHKMPRKKAVVKTETVVSKISVNPKRRRGFWLIVLLIGLLLLAYYKKGWFVSATVNGQPITRLELTKRMDALYKDKVIAQMVNEKILEQEAAKKGVSVSQKEIDDKMAEVETQYGGKDSFNQLLQQQGLTRDEFNRQTKYQLIVEKLFSSEASPSAADVQKFMDQNKNAPEATDEAKFKILAEKQVKQDNLSKIFNDKFQQLKTSAKVQLF